MRRLKVYGGTPFNPASWKQERCVVAAYSQQEVAQVMGCSLGEIRGRWRMTGNKEEIERALAKPHTPIWMGRF